MIIVELNGFLVSPKVAKVYPEFKNRLNSVTGYPIKLTSHCYSDCRGGSIFKVMNSNDIYLTKDNVKYMVNDIVNFRGYSPGYCFLNTDELNELIECYNADSNNKWIYACTDYSEYVFCLKKRN